MLKRYNAVTELWEDVSNVGVYNLIATMRIYAQCSVQLFNSTTNELEYEESGRAVICPSLYVMLKRMMVSLVSNCAALTGTKNTVNSSTANFLRYLILTDSNLPLTSTEYNIPGTVIASADKTSTTSANGLLNLTESFVTDKQAHYVFDFSADKANMAFQSVCMGYQLTNGYAYGYDLDFLVPAKRVYNFIGYGDGYLWANISLSSNVIYKINASTFLEEAECTMSNVSISAITANAGLIYYINSSYIYDDSGNFKNIGSLGAYRGLCNDGIRLYYIKSSNVIGALSISDFDTITLYTMNNTSPITRIFFFDDDLYGVLFDGNIVKLNLATGECVYKQKYLQSGAGPLITSSNDNIYTIFNNAWQKLDLSKGNLNLGARKLLAEPLTKTNQQTMKITYDFIMK